MTKPIALQSPKILGTSTWVPIREMVNTMWISYMRSKEDMAGGGLHDGYIMACIMDFMCVKGLVFAMEGPNHVQHYLDNLHLQRIMKSGEVIISLGFLIWTEFSWQEDEVERGKLMAPDYDGNFVFGDSIRGILYPFYDGYLLGFCYYFKNWASQQGFTCSLVLLFSTANKILELRTMDSSYGSEAGSDVRLYHLERDLKTLPRKLREQQRFAVNLDEEGRCRFEMVDEDMLHLREDLEDLVNQWMNH